MVVFMYFYPEEIHVGLHSSAPMCVCFFITPSNTFTEYDFKPSGSYCFGRGLGPPLCASDT